MNDNLYDHENPLSITYGPNVLLDLTTKETLIYGLSRTPTLYEIKHCPHHIITSDNIWNPHTVKLSVLDTDINTHVDPYTSAYLFCVIDQTIDDDYRILGETSTMLDRQISHCGDSDYGRIVASVGKTKDDLPFPHTFISSKRHTDVSHEDLLERLMIGIEQAKATIEASTQYFVRSAILPMSRRYRTDRYFYRNRLDATFSADIYYGRCNSGRGNKYCFIVAHPNGFCVAYPQKTWNSTETTDSLKIFTRVWGVPTKLIVDGAQEIYLNSQSENFDLFYDIVDHRTTNSLLSGDNAFDLLPNGKPITDGWQICVQWKDGSTDWAEICDVKESYPVQLASYAVRKRLDKEPAFA